MGGDKHELPVPEPMFFCTKTEAWKCLYTRTKVIPQVMDSLMSRKQTRRVVAPLHSWHSRKLVASKECSRCYEPLPLEAFGVDKTKPLGRKAACKSCMAKGKATKQSLEYVPGVNCRCSKCKLIKPEIAFTPLGKSTGNLSPLCKACRLRTVPWPEKLTCVECKAVLPPSEFPKTRRRILERCRICELEAEINAANAGFYARLESIRKSSG